ncbi:PHF12 isoform 5, partial [Pan troglodytes]
FDRFQDTVSQHVVKVDFLNRIHKKHPPNRRCRDTSAGFWRAPHRSAKKGGTGPSCVLPPLRVGRSCEHVLSNPLHRDRS